MVTSWGAGLSGKGVYVTEACCVRGPITAGVGVAYNTLNTPTGDGTSVLSTMVPADGAELIACSFTVTSPGIGGSTQQWSIADASGTALATFSATLDTQAAGSVRTGTMGTATSGRNLATTAGSALTLTNTAVGTSTQGTSGVFRLVWGI